MMCLDSDFVQMPPIREYTVRMRIKSIEKATPHIVGPEGEMRIVEVDPNKKYVLLLPHANQAQAERIVTSLRAFIEDDVHVVFAVQGIDVAIVPADQVVGYSRMGTED